MITPQEYLDRFTDPPKEIWVYGLDLVEHILKGNWKNSFYKDPHPARGYLYELQEEMQEHTTDDDMSRIIAMNLRKISKWTGFDSYDGDLDLDMFIADPNIQTPIFTSYKKEIDRKPAVTLVLDMNIPWAERKSNEMEERHREIYSIAAQCISEHRPCRVIAVSSWKIPEIKYSPVMFIIVKDYTDPLFSGIWGAFKTNETTNSFANTIQDYFIGTKDMCNGIATSVSMSKHIPSDEIQIIKSTRLTV